MWNLKQIKIQFLFLGSSSDCERVEECPGWLKFLLAASNCIKITRRVETSWLFICSVLFSWLQQLSSWYRSYPTHGTVKKWHEKILNSARKRNDKLKVQVEFPWTFLSSAWPEFIVTTGKVSIGNDLLLFYPTKLFFSNNKIKFSAHTSCQFLFFIVLLSGCKSSGSNQIDREMKTR